MSPILSKQYQLYIILFALILLAMVSFPAVGYAADEELIYVIPLEGTVEKGLNSFMQRSLNEAKEAEATVIIIEMDTLGGSIDAAMDIAKTLRMYPKPIITYVTGTATSAGAYIALNTPMIAMSPGSSIGAAEPRDISGQPVDPKIMAVWKSEMESSAEAYGREKIYAAAMVDSNVEIEGLVKQGELLSLTALQAVDVGIADGVYKNRLEVLNSYGYSGKIISVELTIAERLARFVTNPYVMIVLLAVGFIGLAIEFIVPGYGLPGILGITSLATYFLGHIIAGAAGYEVLILFVIGIILLAIELFAPGFGLFGIAGLLAMGIAIVIAAYDTSLGITSLFIALLITIVVSVILIKYFGFRGVWNKFILNDTQQNEDGYAAPQSRKELVGYEGKAVTPLRPAGSAKFEDELVDVVAESGYIASGNKVKVVKVEGVRVVVREIKDK